jgi:hypothetical protein
VRLRDWRFSILMKDYMCPICSHMRSEHRTDVCLVALGEEPSCAKCREILGQLMSQKVTWLT